MMNEAWFKLGSNEVERKLKTNAASGLSRKAARSRVNREAGSLFILPQKSPLRMAADLLSDFALLILLLAAVLSLFFEEMQSGLVVIALLLGDLLVTGYLYYRSQRTMESLRAFFCPTVRVIRDGRLYSVDFRTVVPGDVMLLEEGDVVCCDGRIVTSDRLRVRMRIDLDHFMELEKAAEGHVNPKENRPTEMTNLVHAGSVVLSGSARVIVTSVGKYTYLGARTGGIPVEASDDVPAYFTKLQKQSAKINLILLLAVIPISLLSLLISYKSGGTILLSSAFLTALAIVATTASQFSFLLARLFYTSRIRRMVTLPNPIVLRSVTSACRLAEADYIFLLDGAALTDGILHFNRAVCAEGMAQTYGKSNPSARYLSELASFYYSTVTKTLTTSISANNLYLNGLREFISHSKVDEGALAIRCSLVSYVAGNMQNTPERVCFSDRGQTVWLNVSRSPEALKQCQYAMLDGEKRALSEEGRQMLHHEWSKGEASHQMPMIFTVSSDLSDRDCCFVGLLTFQEGIDPNWAKHTVLLQKQGCRVIAFTPTDTVSPQIPPKIIEQGSMSKKSLLQHGLPLSYGFGRIGRYLDFEKEDILSLLKEVRSRGKKVVVVGFSDTAMEIGAKADGCITCAPVRSRTAGTLDEELRTVELSGRQTSTSCTQTVKQKADAFLPRPSHGMGGLASILTLKLHMRTIHRNLSDFFRYLLWTQVIRLCLLVLPMLIGRSILDARHLLFCSCFLDLFAFFLFLGGDKLRRGAPQPNYLSEQPLYRTIRSDLPLLVATVTSVVLAFLLPMVMNGIDVFGAYLYQSEFLFVTMILLHWSMLVLIRFERDGFEAESITRYLPLFIETVALILFVALCFVWEPFGILFEMEEHPMPYFIASVLPSVALFAVFFLCKRFPGRAPKKPE